MHTENKWGWLCYISMATLLVSPLSLHAGTVDEAIQTQAKTEVAAQASQKQIDALANQTTEMLAEYRNVLRQIESLRSYNNQLDKLVSSQQTELELMTSQLKNIETTQRDIVPLMLDMVAVIGQFIELDLPFLPEERQTRVTQLNSLMERADITIAEKYRRILEAYQVETEYGRTIEAYKGDLDSHGTTRSVDFLRIGRVSLYYLTLDAEEAGMWDSESQNWVVLDDEYRQAIDHGLTVARKQLPPDLLMLPVHTVEVKK